MLPQIARQGIRISLQRSPVVTQANLCSHFHTSLTLHSNNKNEFKPRRNTPRKYRAPSPRTQKPNSSLLFDPSPHAKHVSPILGEKELPSNIQEEIRQFQKDHKRGSAPDTEYLLRHVDLLTAKPGTTEEKMLQRRILNEAFDSKEDQKEFIQYVEKVMDDAMEEDFRIGEGFFPKVDDGKEMAKLKDINETMNMSDDPRSEIPSRHPWSETVVRMDRVQKVQRGGTMVRYRCLVIGGNLRGVAGFGVGKASEPKEATEAASRMCKRNIFFVDAYNNSGLTTDLVGKHNSCIVRLRSTPPNRGLKGHPLIRDILLYFGITDCSAKSHGNRNIYNVVYATFKAIMKHRSIEEIARARGKRFLSLDKAKRIALK